ncbi:HprK-related kinase A [Pseudomaricurvus hydrocarbonicus]|uniref:HprK-related kinase A n=1 Tax=Pseudomaricurvus hydrocarbonicus TaxID=1470433 RepID=UPI001AA00DD7|nr:HprK-related kinase A [Aestuariicella hydrocarbonica]
MHAFPSALSLKFGPLSVSVSSNSSKTLDCIRQLYADYPENESDFFDFHVSIDSAQGIRRWYKPQINFSLDGFKPFKPLPGDQALPLFEWGMNWCVSNHCHDYLVVHAAVVEKQGRVLMLSAPPGAGKSTLCAGLVCRGWRLLSDELALVSMSDDGLVQVTPLGRPVCLKNQSLGVIRSFSQDSRFGPVCYDTVKGDVAHMLAPKESIDRSQELAQLSWVVFPRYAPQAKSVLSPQGKAQSLLNLAKQSFNLNVLGEMGYRLLNQSITQSDCYDFQYSSLDDAVKLFDSLLHVPDTGKN